MWKIILFIYFASLHASSIVGFWTTFDPKAEKSGAIVAVYPHEGQYYGKIIGTYNKEGVLDDTLYHPKDRAPGIEGDPYYSGLDIVWTTKVLSEGKYKGCVVDPEKGKIYSAKLWRKGNNLILRGEVFIFGKNVPWFPLPETSFSKDFPKPDLASLTPNIPKPKW